jgi:hypothetical protein
MTRNAKTKVWHAVIPRPSHLDIRHPDGRTVAQVTGLVRSSSKRKAAEAMGGSLYWFNDYAGETGHKEDVAFMANVPEDQLVVRPMDPGDSLNGDTGYIIMAAVR